MTAAKHQYDFTVTEFPGGDKSFIDLPFEAGSEIERVEVFYTFASGSTIDLGLAHEGMMRGWSGSERGHVLVDTDMATPGYDAGPIAGRWHVVLGIVKVGPNCRVDVSVKLVAKQSRWFVGDLHSHTEHSDGGVTVLDAIYRARASRLDFVALADHNTIAQNVIRPDDPGILVFPSMELTTYWGHTNFHGLVKPVRDWRCYKPADVVDRMHEARANGATITINHPFQNSAGGKWQAGYDAPFDAVEIWNGTWAGNGAQHNILALAFWQERLAAGHRTPITGGSDFHLKNRRRHGRPSNRVWADARSMAAILTGVRAGHNVVSFAEDQTTAEPADGSAPMFGDGAASGTAVAVTFRGLTRGDEIRVISETGVIDALTPTGPTATLEPRLDGRFLRFEVWQGTEPRLFTNPVYAD
jgi:hypothetical protein